LVTTNGHTGCLHLGAAKAPADALNHTKPLPLSNTTNANNNACILFVLWQTKG
jgi:hypothetical protein